MSGWIKIHRKLFTDHWLNDDPVKGWAWLKIIAHVNHEEKKVNIGNDLFVCARGQSLMSLDSWGKIFGKGWNKSKVKRFFSLLERDSMIIIKNEKKTTRLTVCNYESYQNERNASETQVKRKRNQLKNDKNDKEKTIDEIYHSYPTKDPFNNNRSTGKCSKDKDKIVKLLQTVGKEELLFRIENYLESCKSSKTYLKNFSVFLNNLPDPVEIKQINDLPKWKPQ